MSDLTRACPRCNGSGQIPMKLHSHSHEARAARVAWLRANRHLWGGWATTRHHGQSEALFDEMVKAGLFSPKTGWRDVDLDGIAREALMPENEREDLRS